MATPPPHGKFVKLVCTHNENGVVRFEGHVYDGPEYFKIGLEYAGKLTPAQPFQEDKKP
jgi:hypothetical protein